MFLIELGAKCKVLKLLLRKIYHNYKQAKKDYDFLMDEFIGKHSGKIDEFRARLMLNMDSKKLKKILDYEREHTEIHSDHLPLFSLKKNIAALMPNSPAKVRFEMTFSEKEFQLYIDIYVKNVLKEPKIV